MDESESKIRGDASKENNNRMQNLLKTQPIWLGDCRFFKQHLMCDEGSAQNKHERVFILASAQSPA
jgi:hypothetical protein